MPWARLDDQFHRHDRVVDALDPQDPHDHDPAAGRDAIALWTLALSWSYDPVGGKGSPFVPFRIPRRLLHADQVTADLATAVLVSVGLWEPAQGGWTIHDWEDYRATNLTHEQRVAGGQARARTADRKPGGTFAPRGGNGVDNQVDTSSAPGGHQVAPGSAGTRWEPGGRPGDLDQQPGTNPNPIPNPKVPSGTRGVQGGPRHFVAPAYMTSTRWEPFLDAWFQRFRHPPTEGQATTLWEAVDAYPQASGTFVLDCPQGTKAADVIASVLERFHAIRQAALSEAALAEVQADARKRELSIPRKATAGPVRLAAVLDDLPM